MSLLTRRFLFVLLLALPVAIVSAQQAVEPVPWPTTGDAVIDRTLADINEYAARYPASFADEMARYYSVPRNYVEAMMKQADWTPGDITMACAVALVAGQPCRTVVREYSKDHAAGWRDVAQRLDVKPGSAQYRRIRKDLDQTYRRWERPLP